VAGGSFQDAVRRRQAAGFTARTDELARFRANLALPVDDPGRRFIFAVHGDGGVGKTFLSRRLRELADGHGSVTAWVDDRVFGVPEAMQALAADLSRSGGETGGFDKVLSNYLRRRREVADDPDAPAGTAAFITRTAVRVGLSAAHAAPGVGGLADAVDKDAAAGTTKATLYARFGSKDAIFRSVVEWATARDDWPEPEPALPDPGDLESTLREVARVAVRRGTHPAMVSLMRIVIAEAGRFPDLARRAYASPPWPRQGVVADLLEHHAAAGAIALPADAQVLAGLFLGMACTPALLAVFGTEPAPGEFDQHIEAAAALFMRSLARPGVKAA
jgi:AcrR family transcriptional regulator